LLNGGFSGKRSIPFNSSFARDRFGDDKIDSTLAEIDAFRKSLEQTAAVEGTPSAKEAPDVVGTRAGKHVKIGKKYAEVRRLLADGSTFPKHGDVSEVAAAGYVSKDNLPVIERSRRDGLVLPVLLKDPDTLKVLATLLRSHRSGGAEFQGPNGLLTQVEVPNDISRELVREAVFGPQDSRSFLADLFEAPITGLGIEVSKEGFGLVVRQAILASNAANIDRTEPYNNKINLDQLVSGIKLEEDRQRFADEVLRPAFEMLQKHYGAGFILEGKNTYGLELDFGPVDSEITMVLSDIDFADLAQLEKDGIGGSFYSFDGVPAEEGEAMFVHITTALILNGLFARLSLEERIPIKLLEDITRLMRQMTGIADLKLTQEDLRLFQKIQAKAEQRYRKLSYKALRAVVGVMIEAYQKSISNVDWTA